MLASRRRHRSSSGAAEAEAARSGRRSSSSSGSASTPSGPSCCSQSSSGSASCSSGSAPGSTGITRRAPERVQLRAAAAARRSRSLEKKTHKQPLNATGVARPRDRLRDEAAARTTRSWRSTQLHRSAAEGLGRPCSELATAVLDVGAALRARLPGRRRGRAPHRRRSSSRSRPRPSARPSTDPKCSRTRSPRPRSAGPDEGANSAYQTTRPRREAPKRRYQKLAKLTPRPDAQYQLGQAADAAGDYDGRDRRLPGFLKLSPSDSHGRGSAAKPRKRPRRSPRRPEA